MKTHEKWLMGFMAFLFIIVLGVQIGIYEGRVMEREEIQAEFRETKNTIDLLNNEIKEFKKIISDYEHALEVYEILKCESSYRHNVWGDNGESFGIAQIQQKTFNWLKEKIGLHGLRWKDRKDQIILLSWAIQNGYGRLWSCYKRKL